MNLKILDQGIHKKDKYFYYSRIKGILILNVQTNIDHLRNKSLDRGMVVRNLRSMNIPTEAIKAYRARGASQAALG